MSLALAVSATVKEAAPRGIAWAWVATFVLAISTPLAVRWKFPGVKGITTGKDRSPCCGGTDWSNCSAISSTSKRRNGCASR